MFCFGKQAMPNNVVKLPGSESSAEERVRANAERHQRLFDWAAAVLKRIGVVEAVDAAASLMDLHAIKLDINCAEVALAIQDALHPSIGQREEHFRGLKDVHLKQILRNRLADLKKNRASVLRGKGQAEPDWTEQLILDKQGKIVPNVANLVLMLRKAPKWAGVLAFDQFAARVVIKKHPPWGNQASGAEWNDDHETQTQVWFQKHGVNPANHVVGRAVQRAARDNSFHPVRDYLESLVWDGTPRLEMWLQTYFTVNDSPYIRAVGPRWLISGAARIYSPGAQADHTPVLEGPQGKQKSAGLRALVPNDKWYTDRLSHVSSKDAMIELAGILIAELAEMDALSKATTAATKRFLTNREDRFRPPFGRHLTRQARQCIFAASINPTGEGYLKDTTGARRFWPVACEGRIDVEAIRRDRDQLWAEAVYHYKAGAPWWLETDELEALAKVEQERRFVVDPWETPIRKWLGDRTDTSIGELLQHALRLPENAWVEQIVQNRVQRILTRLRFEKYRARSGDQRPNRYRRIP
jgi:predicted P-loop ATPase